MSARDENDAGAALLRPIRDQPLAAAGIAAGLGFVLGGGLRTPAVPVLLGAAARAAGLWITNELLDRAPEVLARAGMPTREDHDR